MPTYEYACRDCAQHVEVVQSFTDAPLRTCGACGGPLRKVFSAAGIIFKGSGYYVTDSRSSRKEGSSTGSGKEGAGKDGGDKDRGSKDGAGKDTGGTAQKTGGSADSGAKGGKATGSTAGEAKSA